MRRLLLGTIALPLIAAALTQSASAQESLFPEQEQENGWVASAAIGLSSPFASDDFSTEWNGRHALTATIEYAPSRDATFGAYFAHAMFDHTGQTVRGPSACMLGVTRRQAAVGIMTHVYAARWDRLSLTIGGNVGVTDVVRERPLLRANGTAYGKTNLPSTLDLGFGAAFGIEAVVMPGTAVSLEAGYEGIENQTVISHSLVARTSVRLSL